MVAPLSSLLTGLCFVTLLIVCHGSEETVNHLILFDSLPHGSDSSVDLDIRTNFSGSVKLEEAKHFRVIINITAPTLQQAYDVGAQIFTHNGKVVLEVKEASTHPSTISMVWVFVGIACATLIVLLCTAVHASHWYKRECQSYDICDYKSSSSSGHRTGAYKHGNTIPMVNLASRDEGYENLRSNEELKQMQEIPEEEDDEIADKEQLAKVKLNDMESPIDTDDSDPHERNLIKSRYHSHSKMIHKDLIKKGNPGKKTVSYKRTYNAAVYKGLPTELEDTSNDEADLKGMKSSTDAETGDTYSEHLQVLLQSTVEPTYANEDKATNVDKPSEPAYANDPLRQVAADVHKLSPETNPEFKHIISVEKSSRPGNIYVTPLELKPVLTTFNPGLVSTPKTASTTVKSPQGADAKDSGNDFDKIPHKQSVNPPWSAQNVPVMSDIMEDPREDQTSIVSDSANSASIYGSSEIFDATHAENPYYNLDSDTDLQPCDVDEIFSDGELPSPFQLNKVRSAGQTNDDIKLIPGALKSPGANFNRMVNKVRPNSSILLTGDLQDLLNAKKSNKAEETVFEFPPPPQSLLESDSDQNKVEDPSGDYIQIKRTSRETPKKAKIGKNKVSLNKTFLHLTVLTTLCMLTLTSGVYCFIDKQETNVQITVSSPKYLLHNFTRIFFNLNKETEVVNRENFNLLVYDVSEPLLKTDVATMNKCLGTHCVHGCDEATGHCICFKGYTLSSTGDCIDINECMESKAKCDKAAGCHNRKGSYDCICGEDYYGDGKKCRECKQECPEDHYEVQACSYEAQKICKECTKKCIKGFYMAKPCLSHENAVCRDCRPPCSAGEYESRQCTNYHDRECKNASLLEMPVTSRNVILEERRHIQTDEAILERLAPHYVGFSRYTLQRGTGVNVELTVRFIDAGQRFLPKNSTNRINTEKLSSAISRSRFVRNFCPSPIPDYYTLQYKKNENQTYKLNDNGSLEDCEPPKFGDTILRMSGNNASFVCSQPGSLTDRFRINETFFLARTKWVDKNKRCQRYSQACESCTRNCGTAMFLMDSACTIMGDDDDNGMSPRLMMCYNCCVKKNCSSDCKEYHKRRCQPEQCLRGNLLQFTLEPAWDSSNDGRFHCHIIPVPNQPILEMDYTVRSLNHKKELFSSTIKVNGNGDWEKSGLMTYSDGILDIAVDSGVGSVPDILEEEAIANKNNFKVGNYKSSGNKLGSSAINQQYVYLRPVTPHGMPALPPAQQECTSIALNDMWLASNMENLYLPNSKLEAVINFSVPFLVTNRDTQPTVKATMSRDSPILSKLYPVATFNVSTFSGDLLHNGSHWLATISGNILKCPGYLSIKLHGPNYDHEIDFSCDTVVLCPKNFTIQFSWETSDRLGMAKDIIFVIRDKKNVHHFRIFRTAEETLSVSPKVATEKSSPAQPVKEKHATQKKVMEGKENSNLPLPLPYLLAICGVIMLLIVLAILGLFFQPGPPETPRCMWYHPVMAALYMSFQFLYSIIVSGSVFFIILTILTSSNVHFLLRYIHTENDNSASVYVELLDIQNHLETNIQKSDKEADDMRGGCLEDVRKIIVDLRKLHHEVLNATRNDFERHHLTLLLNQQKLHVRDKLIKDLNQFRSQYTSAARSVLRQVNQNAQASYHHILYNNSWLVGTRFLFEAVTLLRKTRGQELKSFMEWTGIKSQLSSLEIDLGFSLPALPRLDDMIDRSFDQQPILRSSPENVSSNEPIRSIEVHNNWFFPLDDLQMKRAAEMQVSKQVNHLDPSVTSTPVSFYVFLALLSFCDLILLAHRMCNSWTSTKLFIFGFPEYVRRKKCEEEDDDVFAANDSTPNTTTEKKHCKKFVSWEFVKLFLTRTISTTFFPKITGAIATFFILFCMIRASNKYLNVRELQKMGLYHTYDHYLDLHITMTNARLQTHAHYINTVNLPVFQTTVNGYVTRHQTVVEIYKKYLNGIQILFFKEGYCLRNILEPITEMQENLPSLNAALYCEHLKAIGVSSKCNDSAPTSDGMAFGTSLPTCKFQPVAAKLYERDLSDKSLQSDRRMEASLSCIQNMIMLTSQLIMIYMAIIVLKELACAVLWIMIQRSGIIRLRIIVEKEHNESQQENQLPGT